MTPLWAINKPSTDEVIAAPSSEAALAACTDIGDHVCVWDWSDAWHQEEVGQFLLCVEAEAVQ